MLIMGLENPRGVAIFLIILRILGFQRNLLGYITIIYRKYNGVIQVKWTRTIKH